MHSSNSNTEYFKTSNLFVKDEVHNFRKFANTYLLLIIKKVNLLLIIYSGNDIQCNIH